MKRARAAVDDEDVALSVVALSVVALATVALAALVAVVALVPLVPLVDVRPSSCNWRRRARGRAGPRRRRAPSASWP